MVWKNEKLLTILEFLTGAACATPLAIAAFFYMPATVSHRHLVAEQQLVKLPETELLLLRSATMSEEFAESLDIEMPQDEFLRRDFRTITFGEGNGKIICSPREEIVETGILVWTQAGPSIAMPNNPENEFLILKLCSIRI